MRKLGMLSLMRYMYRDALGDVDAVLYRMKVNAAVVAELNPIGRPIARGC
jgi:hypothetical protein